MSRGLGGDIGVEIRSHATAAGWAWAIAGFVIAAGLIAYALSLVDLEHFLAAISTLGALDVALAVGALALAYLTRIERWRRMLAACSVHVDRPTAAATFLGSIGLNNLLPLRAGDLARAFAFRRWLGASGPQVLGILLVERILDVLTLIELLAIVAMLLPAGAVPASLLIPVASGAAVVVAVGLAVLLLAGPLHRLGDGHSWLNELPVVGRAIPVVRRVLEAIAQQACQSNMASLIGLSVLGWLLEGGLYVAIAYGMRLPFPVETGYLVLTLATLATVIPSAPGYFGTFHVAALEAARLLGSEPSAAASYAIATHMLLWLPLTAGGLLSLVFLSRRYDTGAASKAPTGVQP